MLPILFSLDLGGVIRFSFEIKLFRLLIVKYILQKLKTYYKKYIKNICYIEKTFIYLYLVNNNIADNESIIFHIR